ncbi:MAG: hypothetical protein IJ960_06820 [Oscillospiraceae bacterium]|nr:hypothetical protein [Oscillospiraceae bacterium]
MARLIDADALLMKFRSHRDLFVSAWNKSPVIPPKDKARVDELGNCIAEVLNAPTVDAAPVVHGRWIDAREYCGDYMCSNCDALYGTNKFNYCPNCGARMDGGNADV